MIRNLPRGRLLKMISTCTGARPARQNAYFVALENKYGIDVAIEMDKEE